MFGLRAGKAECMCSVGLVDQSWNFWLHLYSLDPTYELETSRQKLIPDHPKVPALPGLFSFFQGLYSLGALLAIISFSSAECLLQQLFTSIAISQIFLGPWLLSRFLLCIIFFPYHHVSLALLLLLPNSLLLAFCWWWSRTFVNLLLPVTALEAQRPQIVRRMLDLWLWDLLLRPRLRKSSFLSSTITRGAIRFSR